MTRHSAATVCAESDLAAAIATRLCHDLAGPVGALTAGIELMADETDPDFAGETLALLRHSADAAAVRLRFLRLAFGVTGGAALTAGDAEAIVRDFVAASGNSVTVQWQTPAGGVFSDRQARALLLLCLAGLDSLRHQGELLVSCPSGQVLTVTVRGRLAGLDPAALAALDGDGQGVSAKTAPFAVLARIRDGGADLHWQDVGGEVTLGLRLTANVD